ncbi:MAG: colobamin biosynthesis protein cbiL [Pseudomonadota bacterium]|jgi:nickel transport protein
MLRTLLCLVIALALASPASAHRLKVFAKTEAGTISGYGFFIGGGRPKGSEVVFSDATGREVHRSRTGDDGSFSWRPPADGTYHLTLNTGEGHIAKVSVAVGAPVAQAKTETRNSTPTASSGPPAEELEKLLENAVDRAVARRVEPLREAIEAYEAQLRFKDIVAGIAMIIGLAGIAMWAVSRKNSA